jgi:methanogenic corrinoid protein MtbC1
MEARLLALDERGLSLMARDALAGMAPLELAEGVVGPALRRIGLGWQEGAVALSQVYMAGRMSERLLDELLPQAGQVRRSAPRMAIANLEDYHDLGQRIVSSILRASGYQVLAYGRQDVRSLAAMARKDGIELLFVSTLMLRSALRVKDLRKELGNGTAPYLVVGGAPFLFDPTLYLRVKADEMGRDASAALRIAESRQGGG